MANALEAALRGISPDRLLPFGSIPLGIAAYVVFIQSTKGNVMPQAVIQKWEESERGWGIRPDGYSIHPDEPSRERFIKYYWANMPKDAPDEYSRPQGTPYNAEVPDELFNQLSGCDGLRYYDNKYPGDGGKDGWVKR